MLIAIQILALELELSIRVEFFSVPAALAAKEVAFVPSAIKPLINSLTVFFAILPLAFVEIATGEL